MLLDLARGDVGVVNPTIVTDFDGTTVLCQVCGDKASGFHYGVHSCEGCKGFFRRSIQQKIQYKACTKNQNCSILRINRNRCQYCRLKKCMTVGMSRDAVRFGRVPKREKAAMLAAMQCVSDQYRQQTSLAQLDDDAQLTELVVQAHLDTCQFTQQRVAPLLERARRHAADSAVQAVAAVGYTCPLSPQQTDENGQLRDSQLFGPHIKAVVEFAKRVPGFLRLPEEDRVTLLKSSVFEVLLVWLTGTFDGQTNTTACMDGQPLRRDAFAVGTQPRFLLDSMLALAAQLHALRLTDAEVGLFCACVVLAERPGLRDRQLVARIRRRLDAALRDALARNHPRDADLHRQLADKVHDLRTLNTLHADMVRGLLAPEPAETPPPAASSPLSVSSGYVGSEEGGGGRSPSPAESVAPLPPAPKRCPGDSRGDSPGASLDETAAPLPPALKRCPGDSRGISLSASLDETAAPLPPAPKRRPGVSPSAPPPPGSARMPLLKQALSLPAAGHDGHDGREPALVPHKKFRWMRRESGCEPADTDDDEEKASVTPTLSRILGAPPQCACSSQQIRQREVVAQLLGVAAASPAGEQPLNLTKKTAAGVSLQAL